MPAVAGDLFVREFHIREVLSFQLSAISSELTADG
jgi:hypothetical protein